MNDVFISYSRRNKEFTQKLYNALIAVNRTVWADWDSIPAASDWFAEIKEGIEKTNSVLFILSPEWIKSNECRKELIHAIDTGKRLLPILYETVDPKDVPPELAKINWIYMRENDNFESAFQTLLNAMDTDLDWIKTHTRIQVRAIEWKNKNQDHSFVLRGKDLVEGEQFVASAAGKSPEVTPLQGEYILASRKDATRRQRMTLGGVVTALIISVALGVAAVFQRQEAIAAKARAEEAQMRAEEAQERAEQAQAVAEAETRKANSGILSLEAENALAQYPQRALLLALEAARVNEEANEPVRPDAEEALRAALKQVTGTGLSGFTYEVNALQFTKDNRWLVAGTSMIEGEVKIWNIEKIEEDPTYQPFSTSFSVDPEQANLDIYETTGVSSSLSLSPQTTWLVINRSDGSELWQIDDEDESREPLKFKGKLEFTKKDNDNFLLEILEDQVIYWQIDPATLEKKELKVFEGNFVLLSDDLSYLLMNDSKQGLFLSDLRSLSKDPVQLTTTNLDAITGVHISPNNEWLILLKNTPREEYQIPEYDETYTQIGTKPWNSTSLILIPLKQNKKQEFVVDLNFAVDTYVSKPVFSPNGKSFVYQGENPPNQNPNGYGRSFGVLQFTDLEFSNLTYTSNEESFYNLQFINNDWLYTTILNSFTYEQKGRFIDLRVEDLNQYGETSILPLITSSGNITFSDDGNYIIASTGDLINFDQLNLNHTIAIEPASLLPENGSSNELELILGKNPQSVGLEEAPSQITESPDGKWLAAGSLDGSIRLWNKNNPYEKSSLPLDFSSNYIALSNDNQWLAINEVLWKLEKGIPVKKYQFETLSQEQSFLSTTWLGVFSPDSRWLVYISMAGDPMVFSNAVKIIDLHEVDKADTVKPVKINLTDSQYSTLQFSSDSQWLLVGDDGMYVEETGTSTKQPFLYDLENQKYFPLPSQSTKFVFTADNTHMVLGTENQGMYTSLWKGIEIWSLPKNNASEFEKVGEIETPGLPVFSANGMWVATIPSEGWDAAKANETKLWNLTCITEKTECVPFEIDATKLSFSPNSKFLLTQSEDAENTAKYTIWNLVSGTPEKVSENTSAFMTLNLGNTGSITAFTPIPESFGSSPMSSTAGLFSSWMGYDMNGKNVTTFNGYGHALFGGGGGGEFAVGTYQTDIKVNVLSSQDGSSKLPLRGHESYISTTLISPDETLILTYTGLGQNDGGAAENRLRLWQMDKLRLDPTSKPVILPLPDNAGTLQAFAFSPDSHWIYIIDGNNKLHFMPTSIKVLEEQACIAVGRNLIFNEWERYFPNADYRKTCNNLPEHPSALTKK